MQFKKSITVKVQFSAGAPKEAGPVEALFGPVAERYRRRLRRFMVATLAGFSILLPAGLLPDRLLPWIAVPGTFLIFAGILLYFTLPSLLCPGCGGRADGAFGPFCPECGSAGLQRPRVSAARCNRCERAIGSGVVRNYRIRFCTHCGALLHREGV